MPQRKLCKQCGSPLVYWSLEDEEFICDSCHHHFIIEELAEKYKTEIKLVDYNLTSMPDFIFDRNYIRTLDLSAEPFDSFHFPFLNRISSIPSGIGNLTSLEELDLSGNIVGSISPEIGKCRNLKFLYLGRNYIKSIPKEMCNLINLEALNLRYNSFKSLPAEFEKLTSLTWLSISGNSLKVFPKGIGNLHNLNVIMADDNQFTRLPARISNLYKLERLYLNRNRLKSLPKDIGLLDNLKVLDLSDNELKTLPESIVNLSCLKELNIEGNEGLTSPPYEVAKEGIDEIREWFSSR